MPRYKCIILLCIECQKRHKPFTYFPEQILFSVEKNSSMIWLDFFHILSSQRKNAAEFATINQHNAASIRYVATK